MGWQVSKAWIPRNSKSDVPRQKQTMIKAETGCFTKFTVKLRWKPLVPLPSITHSTKCMMEWWLTATPLGLPGCPRQNRRCMMHSWWNCLTFHHATAAPVDPEVKMIYAVDSSDISICTPMFATPESSGCYQCGILYNKKWKLGNPGFNTYANVRATRPHPEDAQQQLLASSEHRQ